MRGNLRFLTWNIRGLNTPKKIRSVLTHLDRLNVHVAYLQEPHLTTLSARIIGARWAQARLESSYSSYARGVIILVRKGTPFKVLRTDVDTQG